MTRSECFIWKPLIIACWYNRIRIKEDSDKFDLTYKRMKKMTVMMTWNCQGVKMRLKS